MEEEERRGGDEEMEEEGKTRRSGRGKLWGGAGEGEERRSASSLLNRTPGSSMW